VILTIAAAALFGLHVMAWIIIPDTESESVRELTGVSTAVTQTS
jgi:hypothetical protein